VLADVAGLVLQGEVEAPREDPNPLVLHVVELERQAPPGLDDEDLPDVAVGLRPDQLVAPGLVHAPRECVLVRLPGAPVPGPPGRHPPRASCSPAPIIASRNSGDVASV
jgi:hypothetical protein